MTDPLAQVPATFVAYRIPSRADDDYYALEVLARILGVGIVVVGDADQIEAELETVAPVTRVPDPLTAAQE